MYLYDRGGDKAILAAVLTLAASIAVLGLIAVFATKLPAHYAARNSGQEAVHQAPVETQAASTPGRSHVASTTAKAGAEGEKPLHAHSSGTRVLVEISPLKLNATLPSSGQLTLHNWMKVYIPGGSGGVKVALVLANAEQLAAYFDMFDIVVVDPHTARVVTVLGIAKPRAVVSLGESGPAPKTLVFDAVVRYEEREPLPHPLPVTVKAEIQGAG